jgi:hypothetical protein
VTRLPLCQSLLAHYAVSEIVYMETGFIGSLWLLKRLPWCVILFVGPLCTTGVIWLLRIIFEGRLYDYSLASFPGDCFIFVYLFCMKQISEAQKLPWKSFFFKKTWHWIIFLSAFVITAGLYGLALGQGGARARFTLLPANSYHFFVQLVLSYAVLSSFPVVVIAKNSLLQCLAIGCLVIYLCLLILDIAMGNLSQHVR